MGHGGKIGSVNATLMVDASWCPMTKVGGYGYWLASDRGKRGGGGQFKNTLESSNLAEMRAIVNSLHVVWQLGLICWGDEILIQTDCIAAIQGLRKTRVLTSEEAITTDLYKTMSTAFDLTLRHVKGHSRDTRSRFRANNHCDRRAKAAMQAARRQIQGAGT